MPFEFTCPHCQQEFRPALEQVGKLAACPACGNQVRIPTGDSRIPTVEKGVDPRWKAPATIWFVQSEDGKQYGPVTGEQLHSWYEEGRITADCQLLKKGAGQWQWATDLYPDLEEGGESKPVGPTLAKPAKPKPAARAAPTQSAASITPLSPNDFPTAGAGLKALGPAIRPLTSGLEQPLFHSAEALENRRKYAPFMVAHMDRPPLHKMLLVVAIGNFIVGFLRGGLFFFFLINSLIAAANLGENPDQQIVVRAAVRLIVSLVMLALNVMIIAGGIGLLQQREWGRSATFYGTLVGMIIQLTGICVTMMLGAEGTGLARVAWVLMLVALAPSILYDAFAATTLSLPQVAADLEE